ncbi:YgfZ/GcvT domain-containing protein [Pirellulaceae bacterium SH449]
MYRLGTATILEIRGKDRCKVLNNVATQDLRSFGTGQSFETFITETKGRSLGHGMAIGLSDSLWFVTVPDQGTRLFSHMDRFIIMEDAAVKDLSESYVVWLATGPSDFPSVLGVPPAKNQSVEYQREEQAVVACWAPWIAEDSILLFVPNTIEASLAAQCKDSLVDSNLSERAAWEALRIAQFWPWYGRDFDDKNLPQEVDRNDQAISFNKGCYLGQETIARLDALGQVQKKLVRVRLFADQVPSLDDSRLLALDNAELEIGQLKSVAKDERGKVVGIAMVKRSHFTPGSKLQLGSDRIPAEVEG